MHAELALVAHKAFYALGCSAEVEDFVVLSDGPASRTIGEVLFFATFGNRDLVCIRIWDPKGQNEFEVTNNDVYFDLECIQDCLTYMCISHMRIYVMANSCECVQKASSFCQPCQEANVR
jgi:hypothetical protein